MFFDKLQHRTSRGLPQPLLSPLPALWTMLGEAPHPQLKHHEMGLCPEGLTFPNTEDPPLVNMDPWTEEPACREGILEVRGPGNL